MTELVRVVIKKDTFALRQLCKMMVTVKDIFHSLPKLCRCNQTERSWKSDDRWHAQDDAVSNNYPVSEVKQVALLYNFVT
jgi:hypothetical protein